MANKNNTSLKRKHYTLLDAPLLCEIGPGSRNGHMVGGKSSRLLLIDKCEYALQYTKRRIISQHPHTHISLVQLDAFCDPLPESFLNQVSHVYLKHFDWHTDIALFGPNQLFLVKMKEIIQVLRLCWSMLEINGTM